MEKGKVVENRKFSTIKFPAGITDLIFCHIKETKKIMEIRNLLVFYRKPSEKISIKNLKLIKIFTKDDALQYSEYARPKINYIIKEKTIEINDIFSISNETYEKIMMVSGVVELSFLNCADFNYIACGTNGIFKTFVYLLKENYNLMIVNVEDILKKLQDKLKIEKEKVVLCRRLTMKLPAMLLDLIFYYKKCLYYKSILRSKDKYMKIIEFKFIKIEKSKYNDLGSDINFLSYNKYKNQYKHKSVNKKLYLEGYFVLQRHAPRLMYFVFYGIIFINCNNVNWNPYYDGHPYKHGFDTINNELIYLFPITLNILADVYK